MSLTALPAGPLALVLSKLAPTDICSASQACRALRHAAQDDSIWHAKALERYPKETVRLGEHYKSFQELMRDDNAEHAAVLLPLELAAQHELNAGAPGQTQGDASAGAGNHAGSSRASCSCRYKYNQRAAGFPGGGYYECLVLALEWDRAAHTFRLYIEARGEQDLRQPAESSLGFTVHRQPPPDRRALERRVAQLRDRRQQLQRELTAAVARDAGDAVRRAEHDLARNATQQQAAERELGSHHELRFADLLTVMRPCGQRLVVNRPGHKLGCLTFDSLHKVDELLRELPDSYACKQHAQAQGLDLCFCYANPIPVMPHGAIVDYEPCVLATVPPGTTLLEAFRANRRYAVPGRLLDELAEEGPEARRRRWAHVPPAFLERQPPWLV